MRNYEMKKTGNRIKTVRCLLTFMWFRQIISAGNVRRQILKLLSGAPAADEVNDQASGNGLLPGVLLPVKENPFPLLLFQIRICRETPPGSGCFPKEFFGETLRAEADKQKEKGCLLYKQKEPDPGGQSLFFEFFDTAKKLYIFFRIVPMSHLSASDRKIKLFLPVAKNM